MKAFASTLFLAALVSARDLPKIDTDTDAPELVLDEWAAITDRIYYQKQIWNGVFQGLYGTMGKVDRPTDECFGDWIVEKRREVFDFKTALFDDYWSVSMDDSRQIAYDMVDLVFLNDEYCHFRSTFWDLRRYFTHDETSISEMIENA